MVDLGCGTGANLRASAPLLGSRQQWTLVDHDPILLGAARRALASWADSAAATTGQLILRKDLRTIAVRFHQADLARDFDGAVGDQPDLVTASALFDLVSPSFIDTFVQAVTRRGAAVYATLSYNGQQNWSPSHWADETIRHAFNVHQVSDKGFGPAAGPLASGQLFRTLDASGYLVANGDSPWHLGPPDAVLLADLIGGIAAAVAETGMVDAGEIEAWRAAPRHRGMIGHVDTLALPRRPGSEFSARRGEVNQGSSG